jgi:hypothetical protein
MNGGNPVSQWISFASDVNSAPNATTGTEYDHTQTFDLSKFIADTLVLTGNFAADDTVLNILINGHPVTGFTNHGSFGAMTAFTFNNLSCGAVVDCALVAGSNTITFQTQNIVNLSNGNYTNPTGLLVEFTSAQATSPTVPEPATLFGVGLGLSILGLVYRRRRS